MTIIFMYRFDRDFCWRTRVQLIPINCSSSNNFKKTKTALESSFKSAKESNIKVRGILLTIPSNPLGTSYNDVVVNIGCKMSSFGLISSQTRHLLASMLSDESLLSETKKRLSERPRMFVSWIAQMGIRCLESNVGLFCWMDFRQMLKEETKDGEIELWRVIVNEVKLAPPQHVVFNHQWGWDCDRAIVFRVFLMLLGEIVFVGVVAVLVFVLGCIFN